MTIRPGMCLLRVARRLIDDIDVAERTYTLVEDKWGEDKWSCYTITFWSCKLPELQHDVINSYWLEEQKEIGASEMLEAFDEASRRWKLYLVLKAVKQ